MKKYIATTICVLLVYLIAFKVVPSYFPSVTQLSDYNSIQVNSDNDSKFAERITSLVNIVDNNNRKGNSYIVNDAGQLDQKIENAQEQLEIDKVNNVIQEPQQVSQTNNTLKNLTLNEITFKEVKINEKGLPVFTFLHNNVEYTYGEGVIGETDVVIVSINVEAGVVNLQRGSETLQLSLTPQTVETNIPSNINTDINNNGFIPGTPENTNKQ